MTWTGHSDQGTRLTWAGTNIDANTARHAADHLYAAVRMAINRSGAVFVGENPTGLT